MTHKGFYAGRNKPSFVSSPYQPHRTAFKRALFNFHRFLLHRGHPLQQARLQFFQN